jgi:Na+/H+-dicarboxylate symporter
MFHKMPFILIIVILLAVFIEPLMADGLKITFHAISISIKNIISFLLPWVVFTLLFKACVTLAGRATYVILIILSGVCISNFLSSFLSHYVGQWVYSFDFSLIKPALKSSTEVVGDKLFWPLNLPTLISNDKAMFGGIGLGLFASFFMPKKAIFISTFLEKIVNIVLRYVVYVIPLFIFGFVVKLQSDGSLSFILKDYPKIFLIIACVTYLYIFLAYWIFNNGHFGPFIRSLRNMMPATISGFTTMSSAASMPLTIIGAQKNAKDPDLVSCTIPTTVNIHLVGDCFAIPILAYAILKTYNLPMPSLSTYIIFNFYFVIAKFSVAAIPGGGIIVMLPILQQYLGFQGEMASMITALYILFDPIITGANVLGNGAFSKIIDKVMSKKIQC